MATTPADLAKALSRRAAARRVWDDLPPSHRKAYVDWIVEAKTPETRTARVVKAIEKLAAEPVVTYTKKPKTKAKPNTKAKPKK